MFEVRPVSKILCEVTFATVLLLLPKDKVKPYATLEFDNRSVVQLISSTVGLIEVLTTELIAGAVIAIDVKL